MPTLEQRGDSGAAKNELRPANHEDVHAMFMRKIEIHPRVPGTWLQYSTVSSGPRAETECWLDRKVLLATYTVHAVASCDRVRLGSQ